MNLRTDLVPMLARQKKKRESIVAKTVAALRLDTEGGLTPALATGSAPSNGRRDHEQDREDSTGGGTLRSRY